MWQLILFDKFTGYTQNSSRLRLLPLSLSRAQARDPLCRNTLVLLKKSDLAAAWIPCLRTG
jgi:hypothetical protein